jgi:hypothetical protein
MGVLYLCLPLTTEPEMIQWLRQHELHIPTAPGSGRNPTLREVRRVLETLAGYTVYYAANDQFWQADIAAVANPEYAMSTTIIASHFTGDEGHPQRISFEKGTPELIIRIMTELAQMCGPLICVPDTGDTPIVVTASTQAETALSIWR